MLKKYLLLTKPGIIAGNAITAVAGYLFIDAPFQISSFSSMLFGLCCIIGSACVCNNYMDRFFDQKMERTKQRASASGLISKKGTLLWALSLLLTGSLTLYWGASIYSLCTALLGFVVYVCIYTPIKVRSVYGTLIGSIAGATPPVVGYTAAGGSYDISAGILFLLMALWQMPHFYAIAIYRMEEYAAANIPVLPVVKGVEETKKHILFYTLAYGVCSLVLYVQSRMGIFYLVIATLSALAWLFTAIHGMKTMDSNAWAKRVFRLSLVVMMSISIALSI